MRSPLRAQGTAAVSRLGVARGWKAAIPPTYEEGTDIVYVDGLDRPWRPMKVQFTEVDWRRPA